MYLVENDVNNKEIDREADVITSEEFDSLESRENKPSFVKKIFSKSKKNTSDSDKSDKKNRSLSLESLSFEFEKISKKLDDLMVVIEMQGGKLDMEKELRSALNERIIDLSSQLGELRSTLISKERLFDKFEVDFASFEEVVSTIKPENIQANFDKRDVELTKLDSKIERNVSLLKSLQNQVSLFTSQMTKIGSFEDLFDILKKIDTKVKRVIESEGKAQQILSKVESLFVELNSKSKLIDKLNDDSKNFSTLLNQQKKDFSTLQNKISNLVKKEDFDMIKKDIDLMKKDSFDKDVLLTGFNDLKSNTKKNNNMLLEHNSNIKSNVSKLDRLFSSQQELDNKFNQLKDLLSSSVNNVSENNSFSILEVSNNVKNDLEEAKKVLNEIRKERELLAKEKSDDIIKKIPSLSVVPRNSDFAVPNNIKPLVDFLSKADKKNKFDLDLEKQILDKGWSKEQVTLAKKYVHK